jgi:uncharacterized protein YlxP (DUF503 family)
MVVGLCRLTLMVSESHSLKEKRMVIRRIKDRVRNKFNAAIAEVGGEDAWQHAVLGFAVVANQRAFVESMVAKIVDFVDSLAVAKLIDDEKEILEYGEEGLPGEDGYAHWEPEERGPPVPRKSARPRIPVRGSKR